MVRVIPPREIAQHRGQQCIATTRLVTFNMKKNSSGFTLIELLVVFSIMGILMSLGMSTYSEYNQRQQVVQSARTIKNQLRSAQGKALSGVKDCSDSMCGGDNGKCTTQSIPLDGWFVNFDLKQIYGSCDGTKKFGNVSFDVSEDITINAYRNGVSTNWTVFYPLGKGAKETTICVVSTKANKIYKLTIAPSGDTNEDGIVTSCP